MISKEFYMMEMSSSITQGVKKQNDEDTYKSDKFIHSNYFS